MKERVSVMQTSLTSICRKRREPGQKWRAEVCWHVRGGTRVSINEGECPGVGEEAREGTRATSLGFLHTTGRTWSE